MGDVVEIKHPLIRHKINLLRNTQTSAKLFRELVGEIATFLTYEATHSLKLETVNIKTWAGDLTCEKLKSKQLTIVPILRAGLGMLEGVLACVPTATVSVVGLYRDEKTAKPIYYYDKLTPDIEHRKALIIDPMLATGGSLCATVDLLKKAGCKRIKALILVAAPEGLKRLHLQHPDVDVCCEAIDHNLNEVSYIIPGLGDAGDRYFGTN
jgi:uracil phosphoribosyltransferase